MIFNTAETEKRSTEKSKIYLNCIIQNSEEENLDENLSEVSRKFRREKSR